MAFFKKQEKELAKNCTAEQLKRRYAATETLLDRASRTGDVKAVKNAMKSHHAFEYALLYKNVLNAKKAGKK